MKKILLGIAVILFGIACLLINEVMIRNSFFEGLGVLSPFVGIGLSIYGTFEDKLTKDDNDTKEE